VKDKKTSSPTYVVELSGPFGLSRCALPNFFHI